ncbi:hypothetical protein [Corynebacterium ulcerans]|uniref:hypothetical protein n=1 Tax=Corynebacterium ulcerans TaxID=65058 RepID=UPI0021623B5E|nr:hypothetical protein [Corynebacterium ulcerans]
MESFFASSWSFCESIAVDSADCLSVGDAAWPRSLIRRYKPSNQSSRPSTDQRASLHDSSVRAKMAS